MLQSGLQQDSKIQEDNQGGVYRLSGKPSCGKSYVLTHLGVEALKEGKRKVFSNSPIIYDDGLIQLSSLYFEAKMILDKNLNGSMILNDEDHRDFWSRGFKDFDQAKKDWFSLCAQHEISYYGASQHEDRVDTIINDCTNLFCNIDKIEIPILGIPICFILTWWSTEEEMKNSRFRKGEYAPEPFHVERVWFHREIANAYNTKFFGKDKRPIYEGESWIDHNKRLGIEYKGVQDYSPITIIRAGFTKDLRELWYWGLRMKKKVANAFNEIGSRFDKNLEKDEEQKEQNKIDESLFEEEQK